MNSDLIDMEISAEKTKLTTSNTSGINTEIKVNGQKLETVTSFKYLGSVINNEDSKFKILSRIAQTAAALTRLKPVARHSERGKKTRQTEEEVGRQHQGVDRPRVGQVPEGSGEQRKMEETRCEIICGAQTTLAVKG